MKKWIEQKNPGDFFNVYADSCDEAVAFVCAAMRKRLPEQGDKIIVVRSDKVSMEQFMQDGKPSPIFILASKKFARDIGNLQKHAPVIIAQAKEGMQAQNIIQRQRATKRLDFTLLNRISSHVIAQALMAEDMKVPEKVAHQLARESGCSITVLRRRMTSNPAIAAPSWINPPWPKNIDAMIVAALVGEWDGDKEYDQKFLAKMAGIDYKKFEEEINKFRHMDDAPVGKIGSIWSVKSRIDALLGVAEFIVPRMMQLFWENVETLLTIRKPELDIPDDERIFASIHGKTPPYSEALFSAAVDTLILLSVYRDQITVYDNIGESVETVVWKVLYNAEKDRWRSLCSLLPKLAEAAPNAFISALEKDLQNKKPAISSLFSSNSEWPSSHFNHTGLLWGLEILAWDKRFLPRVIDVLVQMDFELPENLVNRPSNTILSFFRPWFPQCGMEIDERIKQFHRVCAAHPAIAWDLSKTMVEGRDAASDNALPRWSGVPEFANREGVTDVEYWNMKSAAFDVMKELISDRLDRIIAVLDMFESLSNDQIKEISTIIISWQEDASDEDKAEVHAKVINNIYLCNLRADKNKNDYELKIRMFKELRENLIPKNLIDRHKWLFASTWVELPDYPQVEGREEERRRRQAEMILEIHNAEGIAGVLQMAACCGAPGHVGRAVEDKFVKDDESRMLWIAEVGKWNAEDRCKRSFMSGLMQEVSEWGEMASLGFERAKKEKWNDDMMLSFALALRSCPDVWNAVESYCPNHVHSQYWNHDWVRPCDEKDVPRYVAEAMKNGRPDAALNWAVTYGFYGIKADKVAEILDALLMLPDERRSNVFFHGSASYHIAQAMIFIARSGVVSEEKTLGLEISFYEIIRYSQYKAARLFKRLATDPDFFIDLVCRIYKRKDKQPDEYSRASEKNIKAAAKKSMDILDDWNVPPGCANADNFNGSQFFEWMDKVMKLAYDTDRLQVASMCVGKVLRHLPEGENDLRFPDQVLRWLQDKGTPEMLDSLEMAFFNSRGVVVKSPVEGGRQERNMADKYRLIADNLRSYPRVADVFDRLVKFYERRGKNEDVEAKLNDRRWN